MPQTSILPSSARIALRTLPAMIALAFFVSCSTRDHEIVIDPASCKYAGKSYFSENTYYSTKSTDTHSQDIIQTDDRLPLEIKTSNRSVERDTIKNELVKDDSGENFWQYKYDADGYLTQEIFSENRLQQGGASFNILLFDIGIFKKVRTTSSRITDFRYENGLLKEVTITSRVTYLAGNLPAITKNYLTIRKYNYDSKKSLVNTDEVNQDNYKTVTNYEDGLITSIQSIQPNGTTSKSTYKNENGRKSQIISADGVINFKYDSDGNLLRYESVYQGRVNAVQDFLYDNHINPETLVSTRFKGIPLPFLTVQSREGKNNMIQQKSTTYSNTDIFVSEQNTSFVYNSSGLPETSVWSMVTAGGKFTGKTNYKYSNCP